MKLVTALFVRSMSLYYSHSGDFRAGLLRLVVRIFEGLMMHYKGKGQ